MIKEYQDKIDEMNHMLNDPDALKKKLKGLNPNDTDDELKRKLKEYEMQLANMNESLVDKEKLIDDQNSEQNQIKFNAQIQINLLKKQKDEELMQALENAKYIEGK